MIDQPFRSLYVRPDLAGTSWQNFYDRPVVLHHTVTPDLQHQRDGLRGFADDAKAVLPYAAAAGLVYWLFWRK